MATATQQSTIIEAIDNYLDQWNRWTFAPGDSHHPDDEALDALDALLEAFDANKPLPDTEAVLTRVLTELGEAVDELNHDGGTDHSYSLLGIGKMQLERIRGQYQQQRSGVRRLESIKELKGYKTPCTDQQIAEILNLRDDRGNPAPWQVCEEEATPGKWTTKNPKWQHPFEEQRATAAKSNRRVKRRAARAQPAAKPQPKRPPETIEQLIGQGHSDNQILSMGDGFWTAEDIDSERDRLSGNAGEPQNDSEEAELQASILKLSSEGHEPADIAAELGMDVREVKKAIKKG